MRSLKGQLAAFRLLPLDIRRGLLTALLLTLILYDRWIVVFTIDHACRDIIVAVPADGILGTRTA